MSSMSAKPCSVVSSNCERRDCAAARQWTHDRSQARVVSQMVTKGETSFVDGQGHKLGHVTSGTLSPSLNHPIAMAYLATNHALPHHEVYADVRSKPQPMRVSPMPFTPHRYFRG